MAVLDLARMVRSDAEGSDDKNELPRLKAVASLHGILAPILPGAGCELSDDAPVSVPRVLVLHATSDPFVPPEQVRYRKLCKDVPHGGSPEFDSAKNYKVVVRFGVKPALGRFWCDM